MAGEGAEMMGQSQLLRHQESVLKVAPLATARLSEEKCRRIGGPWGSAPAFREWAPKAQPGH